jgi:ABC-type Co2+ transport system permease subunit
MDQIFSLWISGFLTLSSFVVFIVGLGVGLLNVKLNIVDRDSFFVKLLKVYLFAAALLSLPIITGYIFGGDAAILGGLPIFVFGPVLLVLYPQAVAFVAGLIAATVARDVVFEN